jgi:hypothetical protein
MDTQRVSPSRNRLNCSAIFSLRALVELRSTEHLSVGDRCIPQAAGNPLEIHD